MKYLTRIRIGKTQAARAKLSDSYAWHTALWTAFPSRDGHMRGFLFRVDDRRTCFEALLLSEDEPVAPQWGTWEPKQIAPSFLDHNAYRFQLRANPTMRRSSDRRRLGIYAEPRLREWMLRKAEGGGFRIADGTLGIGAPIDDTFIRSGRRGKHVAVDFSGALTVIDRETFRHAFGRGIGSAKAFGFGMLMLVPSVT